MANGNQGILLNTITFSEFTDLVSKTFVQTQNMVVSNARQLFITQPIPSGTGNTRRFDEVDTETYGLLKKEGDDARKTSVGIGYNKTMTKKRIAREIDITFEMRDENKYPQVGTLLTNLGHFCPQRIELDATHRLTFCSSTSYTDMDGETITTTGGDGYAAAYSAHDLVFSGETWRNRISGDPVFSKGALEAAELLTTTDILSNFGERRVIPFNKIVTGDDPNTVNEVKQFLNSTSDNTQNNSGVTNVYQRKYTHVILPNLATTATGAHDSTKRRWWFLMATGIGTNGWQAYYGEWEASHMNPVPTGGNNAVDVHNDNWTYGTRAGYGFVVVSGRGMIASLPTS